MKITETGLQDIPSVVVPIQRAQFDGGRESAVSARDLHAFLRVGKDFANWMKVQISRAHLVEHQDYETYIARPAGGAINIGVRTEYLLTIIVAKKLAQISLTPRGDEVREYFIECERRLAVKAQPTLGGFKVPGTLAEALRMAADQSEVIETQEKTIATLVPMAKGLERIAVAEGAMAITNAAKVLQIRPGVLFDWLRLNTWIYRRPGCSQNVAYQSRIQQGVMQQKVSVLIREDLTERVIEQPLITAKGLTLLAREFGAAS